MRGNSGGLLLEVARDNCRWYLFTDISGNYPFCKHMGLA